MGEIGILNVGAGDTKLSFDRSNPAEAIRAARIVKDMIRRGYALLVEVDDGSGGKVFTRAHDFLEGTAEYVIADFDPVVAREADVDQSDRGDEPAAAAGDGAPAERPDPPAARKPGRPATRKVPASGTRGIAVSRSAGG